MTIFWTVRIGGINKICVLTFLVANIDVLYVGIMQYAFNTLTIDNKKRKTLAGLLFFIVFEFTSCYIMADGTERRRDYA